MAELAARSGSRRGDEADVSWQTGNPPPHVGGYGPPPCQSRCADSDFGDALLVRGVLTPAAGAPRADDCVRSRLLEWTCGPDGIPAFRYLPCPNGCANGGAVAVNGRRWRRR